MTGESALVALATFTAERHDSARVAVLASSMSWAVYGSHGNLSKLLRWPHGLNVQDNSPLCMCDSSNSSNALHLAAGCKATPDPIDWKACTLLYLAACCKACLGGGLAERRVHAVADAGKSVSAV